MARAWGTCIECGNYGVLTDNENITGAVCKKCARDSDADDPILDFE